MQVPVKLKDGPLFFVEVEESRVMTPSQAVDRALGPQGGNDLGSHDLAERVLDPSLFGKAVDVVKHVSQEMTSGLLRDNPAPPHEVELSLSLGFDAGGNVFLFKGGANASLQLTLKWKLP